MSETISNDKPWRFQPGNPGGPGNKMSGKVLHFKNLVLDNTSDEDAIAIWKALLEKAKAGDVAAFNAAWDRLVGKPKQSVEMEGALELFKRIVLDKAAPRDNGHSA